MSTRMLRFALPLVAVGAWAVVSAPPGRAAPFPIAATGAPFPGAELEPYSAAVAGSALAEFWLGDDPAGNPAGAVGPAMVTASPLFLRASRQDLRALHRQFDEQTGYLDLAGATLRGSAAGFGAAFYFSQPVLRRESQAYVLGDITAPPASRSAELSARESRAGLATARLWRLGANRLALGLAGEWLARDDRYTLTEKTGGPSAGTTEVEFDGQTWGLQAGARWEGWAEPGSARRRLCLGLAWRHVGELELEGRRVADLAGADTVEVLVAARQAVDEVGASVRAALGPALYLAAGAGWRGSEDYAGFGASSGRGDLWALSLRYHDAATPWSVWFGAGQEEQLGAPAPRAGLLGLGLGWSLVESRVEIAGLRRTLAIAGAPNSFDYRVLATLSVAL